MDAYFPSDIDITCPAQDEDRRIIIFFFLGTYLAIFVLLLNKKGNEKMYTNPYSDKIFANQFINGQKDILLKTHAEKLMNFISHLGIKPKNEWLLDVGCGAGILTEYFHAQGFNILGFDHSEYLINIGKERVSTGDSSLNLKVLDILDFSEQNKYSFAFSIGQVINFLFNEKDMIMGLNNIFNALKPGGVLLFDFFVIRDNQSPFSYLSAGCSNNRSTITTVIEDPYNGIHISNSFITVDTGSEMGVVLSNQITCQKMLKPRELISMLDTLGFKDIYHTNLNNLHTSTKIEEIDGMVHFICRKP